MHQRFLNRPRGDIGDPHIRAIDSRYNAMRVAIEHSNSIVTNIPLLPILVLVLHIAVFSGQILDPIVIRE
jgi:hypothetical protein